MVTKRVKGQKENAHERVAVEQVQEEFENLLEFAYEYNSWTFRRGHEPF